MLINQNATEYPSSFCSFKAKIASGNNFIFLVPLVVLVDSGALLA